MRGVGRMKTIYTITAAGVLMIAGVIGAFKTDNPINGALAFIVSGAQAEEAYLEAASPAEVFRNVRASKVYVNPPNLPRFGYSNAVVVNNWTQPLTMKPVFGTEKTARDLSAHVQSAVDQMEREMRSINVTKEALLSLDVYYETTGNSFDKLVAISSVLNEYSASRMAYQTIPHSLNALPVRNIYGVGNVAKHLGMDSGGAKVALIATVLDPATTTDTRLFDLESAPARKDGKATFLVGGLAAQSMDFTVSTEEQPKAILNNLDIVLRHIGAQRKDIEQLKVSYVPGSGLTEDNIRPQLSEYFGGSVPEITWNEVDVAGFAANDTCVEAVGTLVLNP